MSQLQYDEVGSRTRQSWLRTSLGVIVATLLVERSLLLAEHSLAVMLLALAPGLVALGVIFVRMRRLRVHESDAMLRAKGLLFALALLCTALVSVIAVLLPSP